MNPPWGLAPVLVESIFDTIIQINKEGTTILLVEQNALMALSVASPRLRPSNRRNCGQDTAEELKKNKMIQKSYLGME